MQGPVAAVSLACVSANDRGIQTLNPTPTTQSAERPCEIRNRAHEHMRTCAQALNTVKLRVVVHRVPVSLRHRRATFVRRTACGTAVTTVCCNLLRGDLRFRGLDRVWIVRLIAITTAITRLLKLNKFRAHLGAGNRAIRLGERGNRHYDCNGNCNGLDEGLHDAPSTFVSGATTCLHRQRKSRSLPPEG
ncbi:hypothetical protein OKW32_006386 [Paraburkholderia youngii]